MQKKSKPLSEAFMALSEIQQGFLAKNIIVINGDVDGSMVFYVKEALAMLYALKKIPDITVLISSNGGSTNAGTDIFDFLKAYPGKKTAIVNIAARSAAATILQAADERLLAPHAYVLIHHVSTRSVSLDVLRNKKKTQKLREEMERDQERIYKILSTRTRKSVPTISKICEAEKDMNAEEAITFGLADGIFKGQLPK